MNSDAVRLHLREINDELARLDRQRDALIEAVRGLEGWLRASADAVVRSGDQTLTPAKVKSQIRRSKVGRGQPKGDIPMRVAILQAIRDARGQSLSTTEILARARAMGAVTDAARPERTIDLTAYNWQKAGQPIERTGRQQWRWIGDVSAVTETDQSSVTGRPHD